jgi:hypothetical protein
MKHFPPEAMKHFSPENLVLQSHSLKAHSVLATTGLGEEGVSQQKIIIGFGSCTPKIDEQLRSQKLKFDMPPLHRSFLQRSADEVARLRNCDILTEAESQKANARIFRIIQKHAKPL